MYLCFIYHVICIYSYTCLSYMYTDDLVQSIQRRKPSFKEKWRQKDRGRKQSSNLNLNNNTGNDNNANNNTPTTNNATNISLSKKQISFSRVTRFDHDDSLSENKGMVSSNNDISSSSTRGGGGIVRGVSIKSSDRLRGSLAGVVETDGDCDGFEEGKGEDSMAVFIRSSKKSQNYDPSADGTTTAGGDEKEEKGIVIADDSTKGHNYDDLYEVQDVDEHDPDATAVDVRSSTYGGKNYDGWRHRQKW